MASESTQKTKIKKKITDPRLAIFATGGFFAAIVFLSFTVILIVGMLPTLIHIALRGFKLHVQDLTVGAMNFAGCMPFLVELSRADRSIGNAFEIILDPFAIVIIYLAAALGYAIEWVITGTVSNVLFQKGKMRREAITKQQEHLVKQWGNSVTGDYPLDEHGFPVHGDGIGD